MKKYAIFLLPVAAICFVGSLAVSGAVMLVTILTGGHIGGDLPMYYLEFLNLQTLSIALPIVGMVFLLISLPGILSRRNYENLSVVEFSAKPEVTAEPQASDHLKAA